MVFGADWSREAFEEEEELRRAGKVPAVVPITYTLEDLRLAHEFMGQQLRYDPPPLPMPDGDPSGK